MNDLYGLFQNKLKGAGIFIRTMILFTLKDFQEHFKPLTSITGLRDYLGRIDKGLSITVKRYLRMDNPTKGNVQAGTYCYCAGLTFIGLMIYLETSLLVSMGIFVFWNYLFLLYLFKKVTTGVISVSGCLVTLLSSGTAPSVGVFLFLLSLVVNIINELAIVSSKESL